MSNTYTWTVTKLIGYPVFDGQTDVVTIAYCTIVADDGQGHTASNSIIVPTPINSERPFVPYADLTNDIVVGWIQDELGASGVDTIENNLDSQIDYQINPPPSPESLTLPWVAPPAPDLSAPVN